MALVVAISFLPVVPTKPLLTVYPPTAVHNQDTSTLSQSLCRGKEESLSQEHRQMFENIMGAKCQGKQLGVTGSSAISINA